ncbi:IS3 family transposase [Tatumella sp. JGM118]|uniref:IS3 family transposase n=1 Tax=Tatumella sp. JGM118 TaxID=2799796 RepID=UPI001BAFDDFA|nr:IS3 family transposase [Tatumella sp. JGM118]
MRDFWSEKFNSIPALTEAINAYIHYYNHERISLRLNGLTAVEFRLLHLKAVRPGSECHMNVYPPHQLKALNPIRQVSDVLAQT